MKALDLKALLDSAKPVTLETVDAFAQIGVSIIFGDQPGFLKADHYLALLQLESALANRKREMDVATAVERSLNKKTQTAIKDTP